MTKPLEDSVRDLIDKGDMQLDADDFAGAISTYAEAVQAIPDPKEDFGLSLDVFAALGEAYFFASQYDEAARALRFAVKCPGGVENPLVHLRLGQTFFERGDHDAAAKEFAVAYMLGGREVFDGEDPQYLKFLSTRMKI